MTSEDEFVLKFLHNQRTFTSSELNASVDATPIEQLFDDILNSVIKTYDKKSLPKLIICRTLDKYSCVLPIKSNKNKYSYYIVYDQYLNEINRLFNALFMNEQDIGHDLWKFSYELFAEEAILSKQELLATYYGLNKIALGSFDVNINEFSTNGFICDIQQKYILAHEIGHWVYILSKQNNEIEMLNISGDLSWLFEEIKDMLNSIYEQYSHAFKNEDYSFFIEEQSEIIHDKEGIIEECIADAIAFAYIFAYISEEFSDEPEIKLLTAQSLFLQMMNLQLLAMHHMTVSEETFENSTSIRISFFRNYIGLYFEDDINSFEEMIEQTVIRYEDRITDPMLECFHVLEDRGYQINMELIDTNEDINLHKIVGLYEIC